MRSPARLEHCRDGMLRQPVDLEVGMELAQLVGDRSVALRVAESDRRGDIERALATRLAAHPAPRRRRRRDEVADQEVDLDRVTGVREMARPFEDRECAARQLREPCTGGARAHGVVASVDHEHRTVNAGQQLAHALLVGEPRVRAGSRPTSRRPSPRPQPTASSRCFVECGSVRHCEKKNSRKSS